MSIAHINLIVINGFAKVGRNCHIHSFTTIDSQNGKVAIVGEDVYLSNGCEVIGDITIGNGIVVVSGADIAKR